MAESAEDEDEKIIPASSSGSKKRNAFAELMAPKPKIPKIPKPNSKPSHRFDRRDGLLHYIQNPESYPATIVIRTTPDTVLIQDMFPKATVHLLLLPRSPAHYDLHPHDAFEDADFLAMMKREAASAAELAASELRRLLAPTSVTTQAHYAAMDAGTPHEDVPSPRDCSGDIKVGIHAHPSMNHLHVHIMSRDMHSEKVKHRKHYTSFNTPFFIPLADYPLAETDERRSTSFQNANLKRDMTCWRCSQNFGSRFAALKNHLEEEFQEWSKE